MKRLFAAEAHLARNRFVYRFDKIKLHQIKFRVKLETFVWPFLVHACDAPGKKNPSAGKRSGQKDFMFRATALV
jgi:hypothetical protein